MDSRRDIAERVIARWKARGIRIDEDPGFMELVALWTAGSIASGEMRRRYSALQRERSLSRSMPLDVYPCDEGAEVDHRSIAIPDDEPDERGGLGLPAQG
ncbi:MULTISPECIES: hypothetical protein [Rhizobium]|jgi:hypothetical protein|uniref:Uncharacterized protein n=6 Tax=Rhizobium TaxID=379 RepID=A0A7W6QBI2_9HYPH|nr:MULTISPECIES: hypothetical protein [Rhizobium]EGE55327.1 hypothetical protein RHECNPAF_9520013 [Rhizobium etli CNPAF512]KEC69623.1 hypothetical protein RLPCCGM1_p1815 [Rhizobium leguminosarum bv. phaseoli CCGM1]APO77512.1 hypothetical protein AM571_PB00227 [Rhizobium etli 8C-3]ARM91292.1 hypothetical protein RHEC894_PC00260 [Rhizobium sp. CIAT894]ARQ60735.1 hypothetical protein Kim5_PA00265 [Rhizobium sp. Kim5]